MVMYMKQYDTIPHNWSSEPRWGAWRLVGAGVVGGVAVGLWGWVWGMRIRKRLWRWAWMRGRMDVNWKSIVPF